jgi:hypothetical protein
VHRGLEPGRIYDVGREREQGLHRLEGESEGATGQHGAQDPATGVRDVGEGNGSRARGARSGDKAGFARIYNAWQKDFRPSKAFLDAGAKACG